LAQAAWAKSGSPATLRLQRKVALKLLPAGLTEDAARVVARFQQEARLGWMLDNVDT
jgi:hypothetical protein